MSAFPALGFALGAAGIVGGVLYLLETAVGSSLPTVAGVGTAVAVMLVGVLAGFGVLLISALAGAAGGGSA